MKAQTKTVIAMFGGAAALALTVGFGGIGVSPVGSPSATTTHSSASATPARPDATAPAGDTGVHTATLTSCVSGLDC
jgi:hypothetical protein